MTLPLSLPLLPPLPPLALSEPSSSLSLSLEAASSSNSEARPTLPRSLGRGLLHNFFSSVLLNSLKGFLDLLIIFKCLSYGQWLKDV